MKSKFLLGSDPEFFLVEAQSKLIIPAIGLVGGTKQSPLKITENTSIQEDNVMLEINTRPADSEESFLKSITDAFSDVNTHLGTDFTFEIKSSHVFEPYMLQTPQALTFGCDPDYNAYTRKANEAPNPELVQGLRTCSGHLHIGYDNPTPEFNFTLIKNMDLYLGIPSLLLDSDKDRRKLYGAAGALRHKPYGVEYRSLSSFWLRSEELIRWAYQQTKRAVEETEKMMAEGRVINEELSSLIRATINSHDEKAAKKIIADHKLAVA